MEWFVISSVVAVGLLIVNCILLAVILGSGGIEGKRRLLCILWPVILVPIALICLKAAYDTIIWHNIEDKLLLEDEHMPLHVGIVFAFLHGYPGFTQILKHERMTYWGILIGVGVLWLWYFPFVHFSESDYELDGFDERTWEDAEKKNAEMDRTYEIRYDEWRNRVSVNDVTDYKIGTSWVVNGLFLMPLVFFATPVTSFVWTMLLLVIRCVRS